VVGLTCLTGVGLALPEGVGAPLRILFGVPFVLFVPGYVVMAALFPERGQTAADEDAEADAAIEDSNAVPDGRSDLLGVSFDSPRASRGIDASGRLLASVWLSIAVTPLLGLGLNFSPLALRPVTVLGTLTVFTLAVTAVAAVRQWQCPAGQRFAPFEDWRERREAYDADRVRRSVGGGSNLGTALNVLLVASLLVAAGSVAYAVTVPDQEQSFTEFYLLSEDASGELTAEGYPETFRQGQGKPVTVGISNHERQPVNYTVVVSIQRVDSGGDTVTEAERLERFRVYVEDGSSIDRRHVLAPTLTGERLRVQYLLYKGQPPADPSAANAYRKLHFWTSVTDV
jgi:uncharacterized membrane protein